ncbi:MAG: hypothetical protein IPL79_13745 [Myxococcales bacterium]|nr:hypothetical protein [Myxococcales bacterium]
MNVRMNRGPCLPFGWLACPGLALALMSACGDNRAPIVEPPPPPPPPECPAREFGQLGGQCEQHADCDSAPDSGDGYCLDDPNGPVPFDAAGFCVRFVATCEGTPCGDDVCALLEATPTCLPACCEAETCPTSQACVDSYYASPLGVMACFPGTADASDGDACTSIAQCTQDSNCLNDGIEYPDGQCFRVGCTVGNDTTCAGGRCVEFAFPSGLDTACVDTCASDADCREADGYECFDGGVGVGLYCRHPQVGDACTSDVDCGDAGLFDCLQPTDGFVGGYCTVPQCDAIAGTGCSLGHSLCHDPDPNNPPSTDENFCVDRCLLDVNPPQSTCRGGYECVEILPTFGACLPAV